MIGKAPWAGGRVGGRAGTERWARRGCSGTPRGRYRRTTAPGRRASAGACTRSFPATTPRTHRRRGAIFRWTNAMITTTENVGSFLWELLWKWMFFLVFGFYFFILYSVSKNYFKSRKFTYLKKLAQL